MNDLLDLFHLIKSRVPIITIETRDEKDILLLVNNLGKSMRRQVYGWDVIRGFSLLDKTGSIDGSNLLEPTEVLFNIYNTSLTGIFVLLDYHPYLQNDRNIRLLKEIASNAERFKQTIILVSAQIDSPAKIKVTTNVFSAFITDYKTCIGSTGRKGTKLNCCSVPLSIYVVTK